MHNASMINQCYEEDGEEVYVSLGARVLIAINREIYSGKATNKEILDQQIEYMMDWGMFDNDLENRRMEELEEAVREEFDDTIIRLTAAMLGSDPASKGVLRMQTEYTLRGYFPLDN